MKSLPASSNVQWLREQTTIKDLHFRVLNDEFEGAHTPSRQMLLAQSSGAPGGFAAAFLAAAWVGPGVLSVAPVQLLPWAWRPFSIYRFADRDARGLSRVVVGELQIEARTWIGELTGVRINYFALPWSS